MGGETNFRQIINVSARGSNDGRLTCLNGHWSAVPSPNASRWMSVRLGFWDMCSVTSFFKGANVPLPTPVNRGIPLMTSSWSWSKPENDSPSRWRIGFAFMLRNANGIPRISAGTVRKLLPFKYNVWTLDNRENGSAGIFDIPVYPKSKYWNRKCIIIIIIIRTTRPRKNPIVYLELF